jgi:hypothetical protein
MPRMRERKNNREFHPCIHLLLDLAKGGIELPRELLNNLAYILHLSGFKYLCDSFGKKVKREKKG